MPELKKMTIYLHPYHHKLLEQQAGEHYRDLHQHAAWLIGCAVSASAVVQQESREVDGEMLKAWRCPHCAKDVMGCSCPESWGQSGDVARLLHIVTCSTEQGEPAY